MEKGLKSLKPTQIEPVGKFAKFYDDEEKRLYAQLKEKYRKF
jgi:hypothetical protein